MFTDEEMRALQSKSSIQFTVAGVKLELRDRGGRDFNSFSTRYLIRFLGDLERFGAVETNSYFTFEQHAGSEKFTLDPAIKTLWLAALRSGLYPQGKGALCIQSPNGDRQYCCLGVLAKVHPDVQESGTKDWTQREVTFSRGGLADALTLSFLKDQIPQSAQVLLTTLNDSGRDFATIADFVEAAF